jgi:hypothetical protein
MFAPRKGPSLPKYGVHCGAWSSCFLRALDIKALHRAGKAHPEQNEISEQEHTK